MAQVVMQLESDINFLDYICIAGNLAFLPTYLFWTLITKPFSSYARRKPWRRFLGDAAFRQLGSLNLKRLKYIMGTTPWVYATWAKWYNLPTTVTELGSDARLLWIGPKRMEKVILYLHGGGYVIPMQHFTATFWRHVQQELENRRVKVGIATLNYSLIPAERFPTQLSQAVSAVKYLISNGTLPENIQIVGDSAGGNLVLALLSHLLHPLDGIPPITPTKPFAGMYMMSPWLRLSNTNFKKNNTDVITGPMIKTFASVVLADLPKSATFYINPFVAPKDWFKDAHAYVDRFLITAGDAECLHDDIEEFARSFSRVNKETRFISHPDGIHNDPYFDFLVSQPELGVLTRVIVDWIYAGFNR